MPNWVPFFIGLRVLNRGVRHHQARDTNESPPFAPGWWHQLHLENRFPGGPRTPGVPRGVGARLKRDPLDHRRAFGNVETKTHED